MSVYSYVELKVHTNVRKVGTHLNVCLIYRTYVRWKYTCLFSYKQMRSIYLYIMNICSSVGTRTLSLPRHYSFSIILYLYTEMKHSFPHISLPITFLTLSACFFYYIYSIYREYTLPQLFTRFPHSFIILLIYRRGNTFPAPFYPFIKWIPFTPPLSLSFWNVTYRKSLRGKVFENFISIVL